MTVVGSTFQTQLPKVDVPVKQAVVSRVQASVYIMSQAEVEYREK